jgi:hypothetical protein
VPAAPDASGMPPKSATEPRRLLAALLRRWWGCHPRPGVAASGMTGRARCCEPSDHPPRILGVESRNIEPRLGADFAQTVTLHRLSCSNMLRQQVIRCHCSGQSFALDPERRPFMGPDPSKYGAFGHGFRRFQAQFAVLDSPKGQTLRCAPSLGPAGRPFSHSPKIEQRYGGSRSRARSRQRRPRN